MTTSSTPLIISKSAQQGILQYSQQCYQLLNQQWNIREQMRNIDLAYIRENDFTVEQMRAKVANKYGDPRKYQNITVPVVMPQVEAAVTYQSAVFLQGTPLFGVVASPEFEDEAIQMEALIEENSIRGGWARHIMMHFRDGFKYNIAALEIGWGRCVTAALETDVSFSASQARPKQVIWEGNTLKRLDMYNTFWDSRVAPTEIYQKGEFAGYTEMISRVALKQLINELPDKMVDNIKEAFESGLGFAGAGGTGGIESFYIPQINPDAILKADVRTSTDWMAWASLTAQGSQGTKIAYRNLYEITTLYGRIIPSDFNLKVPSANTPQVWKFLIINHQVIIYAERQTNAHGNLPILFSQPNEDGLWYQTKSTAQNMQPFQEVSTALMASTMAARRRAISDRGLYDPSRVTEANINSDNPSAKIPVRPAAYGKPLSDAYFPIPFRDDQSPVAMQEITQLKGFADYVSGHNQAQQGQFVKGNKTLHEYQDVMSHANGRDQMTSILLEAQLFTPLKEMMKLNYLQYQGGVSLYSTSKQRTVDIDPVELRKSTLNFKVSDGLTPTDKLINADAFQVSMQVIGSSPQIAAGYNIGPMFSYMMKTQGAHISEFEKSPAQVAFEQATSQWQQTIMQMAKDNPAITPQQYPPQPTPQQYNYIPGAPASQQGKPQPAIAPTPTGTPS